MATSSNKKKATAKERATEKSDNRGRASKPKVPASVKAASKSRFAGERTLTGEDRPSTRAGGKTAGAKAAGGKTTTGRIGGAKAGGGKTAGAKVTGGKTGAGRSTSAAR